MTISERAVVVGLTGAFGSGCTTAARHLASKGWRHVTLSDVVRGAAKEKGLKHPTRQQLQAVGDELREAGGRNVLVTKSLDQLEADSEVIERIVIDGVRNLGEVDELRQRCGFNFSLVAVMADPETRWDRVEEVYERDGLSRNEFLDDDNRDKSEEGDFGQQVARCVDEADAVVTNHVDVKKAAYRAKIDDMVGLLTGSAKRRPTADEINMQQAFTSSHHSKCAKRHVGAIIVGADGESVGAGYNENPRGTLPCVDEPKYDFTCHRDLVRNDLFAELAYSGKRCPECGEPLAVVKGPPWECPSCREQGRKTDLERFFMPERAMSWCTAIHAEDRALIAAGTKAEGGEVVTTTFPCFQCAEKLINAGIRSVLYVETYPDPFSADRLNHAGVELRPFEGVRAVAFGRVFASSRPS